MSEQKTLILASNAGAYCYPWANSSSTAVVTPETAFANPKVLDNCGKVILINGVSSHWMFHQRWTREPKPESYFFLWDPARCPHYAPKPEVLQLLKGLHQVYSFQEEDCADFGLRFNSTMYAPPPPGLLHPAGESCDVLFLGVPKDRLPLLRQLYDYISGLGLRAQFRIGLTSLDQALPEQHGGWQVTREWMSYPGYLQRVMNSRCLLDIYQLIQTGYSLRVMEHLFFGKKLITNNRVIRQAEFYHPNNIFLLYEDDIADLAQWLDLPFVPVAEEIKAYYTIEQWITRFI